MCVFVILPAMQFPGLPFLSQRHFPKVDLSGDALGGACTGLSMLLIFAFFVIRTNWFGRWVERAKLAIVCLVSLMSVVLPTVSDISARATLGLQLNGQQVSFAHDGGVLQTEAAVQFLLQGQNPYAADYRNTQVAQGMDSRPELWRSLGFEENPAYHFYAYPPLTVLISVPFYAAGKHLLGWYDQRILHLIALALLGVLGYALPTSTRWKLPLMTLLVLSPVSALFFVFGMNDVLCTTAITATFYFLTRKKLRAASLLLGLSCGLKQFAWVLVPFHLAYICAYAAGDGKPGAARRIWALTWPLFVSAGILLLPFLVWNPRAFIYGLLTAQGSVYPFRSMSLGFANFLILFRWIHNLRDPYPAVILYVLTVLPVTAYGVLRILREKTLKMLIVWYATALFLFLFFSRHFAHNYLGFLFALISINCAVEDGGTGEGQNDSS